MECVWDWLQLAVTTITSLGNWLVRLAEHAAWPIAIAVILFWFRRPLAERIKKGVVTARHGDTEITLRPDQQDPETAFEAVNAELVARNHDQRTEIAVGRPEDIEFRGEPINPILFPRPVIEEEKQALANALVTVPSNERDWWLKMRLIEARVIIFYATINNSIFGSQIDGLKELSNRGRVSLDDARSFYEEARQKWPAVHLTGFDGWAHYLVRSNLIHLDATGVEITDFGKGFLEYLRVAHPTQIKAF